MIMVDERVLLLHVVLSSLSLLTVVHSLSIRAIPNTFLAPLSSANVATLVNLSCDQCLCSALEVDAEALNCFPRNRTCQLFDRFPQNYRLQSMSEARLYFPRGVLPNVSECDASGLNKLLSKLSNAIVTSVDVTAPRCLAIDNHGYVVTVEGNGNLLSRFNPHTMTLVDSINLAGGTLDNIVYYQEAYFITRNDQSIIIVDSNNLSTINVIPSLQMSDPRDIIFLRHGQTMVLASAGNSALLFFNCTNNLTRNYVYAFAIPTAYPTPHGLWYVNDSFFYATSWTQNTVFSYSTNDGITWTPSTFIDARTIGSAGAGSHVLVDDCQRSWFSMYNFGLGIFDSQGNFLAEFIPPLNELFHAIFMDNYVMYLSDLSGNRIVRLDPTILQ